jgi:hypothetical protein
VCIYFCYNPDAHLVKIGYCRARSGNHREAVLSRIRSALAFYHGTQLWLLGTTDGTLADERNLHHRFAIGRTAGEWFAMTDDIAAFLDSCKFPHSEQVIAYKPTHSRKRTMRVYTKLRGKSYVPTGRPRGRPVVYGKRQRLLVLLPRELVKRVETARSEMGISQSRAAQEAVEAWIQSQQPSQ